MTDIGDGTDVTAIWNNQLVDLTQRFTLNYQIRFSANNNGADGIVFVLGDPAGPILGPTGGGLGIGGYTNSIAVEIDVFGNGTGFYNDLRINNVNVDHASLFFNGVFANSAPGSPVATGELEDGLWRTVQINWDPCLPNNQQRIQVSLDQVMLINHTEDMIGNHLNNITNVRWGYTASTGSNTADIDICTPNSVTSTPCSPCDLIVNNPHFSFLMDCNKGSFTDNSTHVGGNFALVRWIWGDGTPNETALPGSTTDHVFPGPGTYNVCMVMENYVGNVCCHDTICQTVTIIGDCSDIPDPQFTITKLEAPCNNQGDCCVTTLFQNQADFPPTQVIWNWGDGTSSLSNGPNFNGLHNYGQTSGAGIYVITVTAIYHPPCLKGVCCIKTTRMNYRLDCNSVIIDPNGSGGIKKERLTVVEATASTSQTALRVYPMPLNLNSTRQLSAQLEGMEEELVTVKLIDVQGKTIVQREVRLSSENTLVVDLPASVTAGIYFFQAYGKSELIGSTKVLLTE